MPYCVYDKYKLGCVLHETVHILEGTIYNPSGKKNKFKQVKLLNNLLEMYTNIPGYAMHVCKKKEEKKSCIGKEF